MELYPELEILLIIQVGDGRVEIVVHMDTVHIEFRDNLLHDIRDSLSDFRQGRIVNPHFIVFLDPAFRYFRVQPFAEITRGADSVRIQPCMEFDTAFMGLADQEIHQVISRILPGNSSDGAAPRLVGGLIISIRHTAYLEEYGIDTQPFVHIQI